MPYGSTREVTQQLGASQDSLGKLIADSTRNEIDIASHYNFSPERSRIFYNGSRQFIQYGETSNFTDGPSTWDLSPAGGDTMALETAESATYVVNYVLQASWAAQLSQELQDGDELRIGAWGGDDGWYLEQRGADHTPDQCDIIRINGGVTNTLRSDVELPRPTTGWYRYEMRYNWYNAGNQIWLQTFTDDGEQTNKMFEKTSTDGERATENANVNIRYEIEADADTTGLTLEVGSMGLVTLGDVTTIARDKPQGVEIDSVTASDDTVWEPIYAVRIDPDNDNVNATLNNLNVVNYGGNAALELVAASIDKSKTDASEWDVPEYHHEQNSALQDTTNISEVPNASGTQKVLASGEKFGGYTLAAAQVNAQGVSQNTAATTSAAVEQKKHILNSDVLVFLARSSGTGTLTFVWDSNQDW